MKNNGQWYDIDEFFKQYEKQEEKTKTLPSHECLKRGKRKKLPGDNNIDNEK